MLENLELLNMQLFKIFFELVKGGDAVKWDSIIKYNKMGSHERSCNNKEVKKISHAIKKLVNDCNIIKSVAKGSNKILC